MDGENSVLNNANDKISEESAALYDRQIRLWGSSAQRNIQNLKILLIGATGVGVEIAKNLILSGIKSLAIIDNCSITKEDVGEQYILTPSDIGKNRAEANMKGLKILNKNVEVSYEDCDIIEKPMKYFKQFNVVVMTTPYIEKIVFVDEICRDGGVKFFYACVFGEFGFSVCDVACVDLLNANKFIIQHNLDKRLNIQRSKNNCYLLFKVLHEFTRKYGRKPTDTEEEKNLLIECRKNTLKSMDVFSEYLPSEYTDVCFGEFGPTCTIVGGVLAQDIIKGSYCEVETGVKFFDPLATIFFCIPPNFFETNENLCI